MQYGVMVCNFIIMVCNFVSIIDTKLPTLIIVTEAECFSGSWQEISKTYNMAKRGGRVAKASGRESRGPGFDSRRRQLLRVTGP